MKDCLPDNKLGESKDWFHQPTPPLHPQCLARGPYIGSVPRKYWLKE